MWFVQHFSTVLVLSMHDGGRMAHTCARVGTGHVCTAIPNSPTAVHIKYTMAFLVTYLLSY